MKNIEEWKSELKDHLKHADMKEREFIKVETILTVLHELGQKQIGGWWPVFANYHNIVEDKSMRELMAKASRRYPGFIQFSSWQSLLKSYNSLNLVSDIRLFEIINEENESRITLNSTFRIRNEFKHKQKMKLYLREISEAATKKREEKVAETETKYLRYSSRDKVHHQVAIPEYEVVPLDFNIKAIDFKTDFIIPLAELKSCADEMDRIHDGNWAQRYEKIRIIDDKGIEVKNHILSLKQIHIVGAVSSGKSTLIDIIVYWAQKNKHRIALIVSDTSTQLNKVELYNALNIKAVPFITKRRRYKRHQEVCNRLLNAQNNDANSRFNILPDSAQLKWVSDFCLLNGEQTDDARIKEGEEPCDNLKDVSGRRYSCPYQSICPQYIAFREMQDAYVWIFNPYSLVFQRVPQSFNQEKPFLLELVYSKNVNLVIMDEVDKLQLQFDTMFTEEIDLTGSGSNSSLDSTSVTASQALTQRNRSQFESKRNQLWYDNVRFAKAFVDNLLIQLLADGVSLKSKYLRTILKDRTFSPRLEMNRLLQHYEVDEKTSELFYALIRTQNKKIDSEEYSVVPNYNNYLASIEDNEFILTLPQKIQKYIEQLNSSEDHQDPQSMSYEEIKEKSKTNFVIRLKFIVLLYLVDYFVRRVLYQSTGVGTEFNLDPDSHQEWGNPYLKRNYSHLLLHPLTPSISGYRLREERRGGANIKIILYSGVGRFLMYHTHDLYSYLSETHGPPSLQFSATSWIRETPEYHVAKKPSYILKSTEKSKKNLASSKFSFVQVGNGITVSGISGDRRLLHLKQLVSKIINKDEKSHLAQFLEELPEGRKNVLLIVGSYDEAEVVSTQLMSSHYFHEIHLRLISDSYKGDEDRHTISRGMVENMKRTGKSILIAPLLAIDRGYNILNEESGSFFGGIGILVRPIPVPYSSQSLISILNDKSVNLYEKVKDYTSFAEYRAKIQKIGRNAFKNYERNQTTFMAIKDEEYQSHLIASATVLLWQVIGRTIRGEEGTVVKFYDQAFFGRGEVSLNPFVNSQSFLTLTNNLLQKKRESDFVDKELYEALALAFNMMTVEEVS